MSEKKSDMKYLHCKTAIVGAGLAGISTAHTLLKKKYNDFLIFEAENRIGGRCLTMKHDKGFLELGPQFIIGQMNNPLLEQAMKKGLVVEEDVKALKTSREENDELSEINIKITQDEINNNLEDVHMFVTQNGEKISIDFANRVYKLANRAFNLARDEYSKSTDLSVGDFVYKKFCELCEKELRLERGENLETTDTNIEGKFSTNELRCLIDGFFLWRSKWECIMTGCDNIYNLSLNNYGPFKQLKGSQLVKLKTGFNDLLESFIDEFKQEFNSRIKLNYCLKNIFVCHSLIPDSPVKSCEHCCYTNDHTKVVLIVTDNSNKSLEDVVVLCDNVICTMSLGFLKENFKKMLDPVSYFPEEKFRAIENLGFGTYNKLYLEFDRPFWNKQFQGLNLIYLPKEKNFNLKELSYRSDEKKVWYEDICSFKPVYSIDNVLCAYMPNNEHVEELNDKEVIKECTRLLKKFMCDESIPEPKNLIRSKWSSDPYIRGTSSHIPIGASQSDFDVIAKPVSFNNKLYVLFAGEATDSENHSTVHGAYLSGIREAKRILNEAKF
jgi:monoamine oxidase